jgi:hypothetical protein
MAASKSIVAEIFTSKYFMVVLTWISMCTVIYFQRKAFVAHVVSVTYQLLIVLYQINSLYGRIKNKYELFYYFVVAGGTIHTFVPVFGIFYPVAMYGHIAFCFLVHILHLTECYIVFADMKVTDPYYIGILLTVNLLEFGANFAFMFPQAISDAHMVPILLCVEIMALLISILKVRRETSGSNFRQIKVSPESQIAYSQTGSEVKTFTSPTNTVLDLEKQQAKSIPKPNSQSGPGSISWTEWALNVSTSRLALLFIAEATVLVVLLIPEAQFGCFTVANGFLLALSLLKTDSFKDEAVRGNTLLKLLAINVVMLIEAVLYWTRAIHPLIVIIISITITIATFAYVFVRFRQIQVPFATYAQYTVLAAWVLAAHVAEAVSLPRRDTRITGLAISCCMAWMMIVGIMKLKK